MPACVEGVATEVADAVAKAVGAAEAAGAVSNPSILSDAAANEPASGSPQGTPLSGTAELPPPASRRASQPSPLVFSSTPVAPRTVSVTTPRPCSSVHWFFSGADDDGSKRTTTANKDGTATVTLATGSLSTASTIAKDGTITSASSASVAAGAADQAAVAQQPAATTVNADGSASMVTTHGSGATDATRFRSEAVGVVADAVAIAHALHDLLHVQNRTEVVGSELLDALITRVRFEGVTGLIDFYDASADPERLFHGDRRVGVSYRMLNHLGGPVPNKLRT